MAYLTKHFDRGNCTTGDCLAFYKGVDALAAELAHFGCNETEVNATAQMERREEKPEYHSKCDAFHTHLIILNQQLENQLLAPSNEDDRSYTYKCISVHASLPEIAIWSDRCAYIAPTIGNEMVVMIGYLQRLGCAWNTTCGPGCVSIGFNMFETVRMMGPWQCSRFDLPSDLPPDDPYDGDIGRPTLWTR